MTNLAFGRADQNGFQVSGSAGFTVFNNLTFTNATTNHMTVADIATSQEWTGHSYDATGVNIKTVAGSAGAISMIGYSGAGAGEANDVDGGVAVDWTPTTPTYGTITLNTIDINTTVVPMGSLVPGTAGLYFDSTTAGGDGGINSWVKVTTDTATGLLPNAQYSFQVKRADAAGNETAYSPISSVYTRIETPAAPSFGAFTTSSVVLNAAGLSNIGSGVSGVRHESVFM